MDDKLTSPFALEQQQMSEHIYAGEAAGHLEGWRCSDRIPKEVALGIYQNNLHGGVSQHLQTQFPIAHAYIGAQGYQFICANYLKASPPEQPIFTLYAAHFPGFLIDYGEEHPQQAIWSVAARLAQIDFFHHNTFCEDQRINVEENYYQLWVTLKSLIDSDSEFPTSGLYQRLDLHPERHQKLESNNISLVTFWQSDNLFFRME
jgi:hypothetical protein